MRQSLCGDQITRQKQILKMTLLFMGWQSLAMLLGSLISEIPYVAMNYMRTEKLFRAASAVIFFAIAVWLMIRALRMQDPLEHREDAFAWKQLCLWALLTSVDTFLTGIGMGFLNTWSICAENARNMRKTGINVRRSCGTNSIVIHLLQKFIFS